MSKKILSMSSIVKTYHMGMEEQEVLKGINLEIYEGEFVSILGPSGSGKSTLMNIIGCLDTPTSGDYTLSGRKILDLEEKELSHIRSKEIGFVFQSFHLLSRMTALENVELPLIYSGVPKSKRRHIAESMLEKVGLGDKINHYPNQLSGGQQQRVAIARALSTNPTILLADEPTGALDQKTGRQVMKLFTDLNNEGRTIIMITHDISIAQYASRVVRILDGNLFEQSENEKDNITQSINDNLLYMEVSNPINDINPNRQKNSDKPNTDYEISEIGDLRSEAKVIVEESKPNIISEPIESKDVAFEVGSTKLADDNVNANYNESKIVEEESNYNVISEPAENKDVAFEVGSTKLAGDNVSANYNEPKIVEKESKPNIISEPIENEDAAFEVGSTKLVYDNDTDVHYIKPEDKKDVLNKIGVSSSSDNKPLSIHFNSENPPKKKDTSKKRRNDDDDKREFLDVLAKYHL